MVSVPRVSHLGQSWDSPQSESTARNPTTYRSHSVGSGGLGDLGRLSHFLCTKEWDIGTLVVKAFVFVG